MNTIQSASLAPAAFLIASFWQGLLLTGLAWTALRAFPKIPPRTRFFMWIIVFVLAALLPISTGFHSAVAAAPASSGVLSRVLPHLPAAWAVAMVALWALTSLFCLARLLWNAHRLLALARASTPVEPAALDPALQAILTRNCSRPVDLRLSEEVDAPAVVGFFRPSILLPEWLWQKLGRSELSQIVIHEMAHLERRDDWTNLLQKLFRALFPLNPALMVAERQLCWEREMACDDAVLDASISPREYATCLTSLAEKRLLRRAQSLAPGAWQRRSELAERVHRILKNNPRLSPLRSRPVVVAFLSVYACIGVGLLHAPQMVTFIHPAKDAAPQAAMRDEISASSAPRLVQASFTIPRRASSLAGDRFRKSPAKPALGHATRPKHRFATAASIEAKALKIGYPGSVSEPHIILSVWQPSQGLSTFAILTVETSSPSSSSSQLYSSLHAACMLTTGDAYEQWSFTVPAHPDASRQLPGNAGERVTIRPSNRWIIVQI